MNVRLLFALVFLVLFMENISAQVIFEPVESPVYNFLSRMSISGRIDLQDEVLPLSRKEIGEYLTILYEKKSALNRIENQELKWYLEKFRFEAEADGLSEPWELYSYSDSNFVFHFSPQGGGKIKSELGNMRNKRWWGFRMWGTYGDWLGASFDFKDYGEFGDNITFERPFTPERGSAYYLSYDNGVEYSNLNGGITLDWGSGDISLVKDYMTWGHEENGNLIISDKAPSWPQIRLRFKPTKWFRFYYVHGWLNSQVDDSSRFYYGNPGSDIFPLPRKRLINKYIAANLATFTPFDFLDFSVGNSIIYSGDIRPEFFIPIFYFKTLDRETGRQLEEDGNGQIFFDLLARYPRNYKFSFTFFLDVAQIRKILSSDFWNTWFGFSLGIGGVNQFTDNLDFNIEYTRVNPWVYEHKDITTTYKHAGFGIGHWIGQNADQLHLKISYKPVSRMKLTAWFRAVRKGSVDDIYYAYAEKEAEDFLYGKSDGIIMPELQAHMKLSIIFIPI